MKEIKKSFVFNHSEGLDISCQHDRDGMSDLLRSYIRQTTDYRLRLTTWDVSFRKQTAEYLWMLRPKVRICDTKNVKSRWDWILYIYPYGKSLSLQNLESDYILIKNLWFSELTLFLNDKLRNGCLFYYQTSFKSLYTSAENIKYWELSQRWPWRRRKIFQF